MINSQFLIKKAKYTCTTDDREYAAQTTKNRFCRTSGNSITFGFEMSVGKEILMTLDVISE